jgi:hypothetical protein
MRNVNNYFQMNKFCPLLEIGVYFVRQNRKLNFKCTCETSNCPLATQLVSTITKFCMPW